MKILKVLALAAILMVPTGCMHISKALQDVIPNIEAKASGKGIGLSIQSDLGVKLFCLKSDGEVAARLAKIPVLGSVVVEVVGTCPVEEVPVEPAPAEAPAA